MAGSGGGGKTVPLGHQEPISRDAQRGVMVESAPVATFEVPQPQLLFQRRPTRGAASQNVEMMHEQTGSHLRSSLFRSPEGESHDRQSDRSTEGIRGDTRLHGAAGMGVPRGRL